MADDLESLLRAASIPDPDRADAHWAEYRSAGPGAEAAFRTLLAWYGLALYRRVWGFVRSDAADDVFQDVLAKLHRDRGKLATWADAHTWLRTVAVREVVTLYRRDRRRRAREARSAFRPDDADPGDGPATAVACAELRAALVRLPESHRQVVALLFFEGLSVVEAAKVLGKDRDTVAAWRDAALGRLRKLLPAGGLAVGGSAGVEGALAAGRPVVSSLRLGELGCAAWTRAVPGPTLGKTAAVLLAGLTLGGIGFVGWVMAEPAPAPETAQVPPPNPEPPPVPRETLQAQNLRILNAEVLPKLTAAVAKLTGGGEVKVTEARAEGSEIVIHLTSSRPLPTNPKPLQARLRYCVLMRSLSAQFVDRDGRWRDADLEAFQVWPTGRDQPFRIPFRLLYGPLDLKGAFDALPADDRAFAEWVRWHLDDAPDNGPELVVPQWSLSVTGNGRYLYFPAGGHLLARDAGSGFVGWKCIGPLPPDGERGLQANDRTVFATSTNRIWMRPAEPTAHPWRPFGPWPPRGAAQVRHVTATRDGLFAYDAGLTLWTRTTAEGPGDWRRVGTVPSDLGHLMGGEDRLYYLGTNGRAFVRPTSDDGTWEPFTEAPRATSSVVWAGRLVCWRYGPGPVVARPLTPGPAEWVPIGRAAPHDDFLNWRW